MIERIVRIFRAILRLLSFFITSYCKHWFAAPAGAIAAVVSTVGAAGTMILVSKLYRGQVAVSSEIFINGIIAPLLAYLLYLISYYTLMFVIERRGLHGDSGELDPIKVKRWLSVVKYDYLAHVPSDIYLISLASMMQMGLQLKGTDIFYAVLISQFVDDFITFLKEPAIWSGAKQVAHWEGRSQTTLLREAKKIFTSRGV